MSVQGTTAGSAPLVPPKPDPAPYGMGLLELGRRLRTNGLSVFAAEAYGEEVLQRSLMGRTSFLLNAPEAIRHVLVERHETYTRTNATLRVLGPLLGTGLFISEGRDWRHQRRTVAPAFTPKAVASLVPHMLAPVEEVVGELRAAGGEPVDLFSAVQRLALEIAARTMFSVEIGRRSRVLRDLVARYSRGLGRPRLLDILLPSSLPSPIDLGRGWFRRRWTAFFDQLVAERRRMGASADQPPDLFDLLLAARDPQTGQTFSATQLRDQAATMIVAGHETTASALSWALYLLALAPEAQERVAGEADAADPARDPAPLIENLPYTRAVLDEAMRLYPPAYLIVRVAREPDEVMGRPVRPGDLMSVSPWVLHRHRRRWANPDAFDPERFLPGGPVLDRYAYLPFGIGPRVCIGAHFALTEATLVLSRLLGSFRIELASTRPVMPVGAVTTQPDHQPPFRLRPR